MGGRRPSFGRQSIGMSMLAQHPADTRPTPGQAPPNSLQQPACVLRCAWMLRDVEDNIPLFPQGLQQPDRFQDCHEDQVTAMEFGANSSVAERSPAGARISRRRPLDTRTECARSTPDFAEVGRDTGGGRSSIEGTPRGGRATRSTSVRISKPKMA